MKFKLPVIFSIIILCHIASFSQERKFEIEVSLDETSIERSESEVFATIIIKNKSKQILRTDGLGSVEFTFSKNMMGSEPGLERNNYSSKVRIPSKNLRENESMEFRVNLADENWYKADTNLVRNGSNTSFESIPQENIFFYASVKILKGYRNVANPKVVYKDGKAVSEKVGKRPIYDVTNSNLINVTLN